MVKTLKKKIKIFRDSYHRKLYQNFFPTKKLTKRQRSLYRKLLRRFAHIKTISKEVPLLH